MSDGPEFEEVKITAADVRRRSYASALLLGAMLPGMAEVELEPRGDAAAEAAALTEVAGADAAGRVPELRLRAEAGIVLEATGEIERFAGLFPAHTT